MDAGEFERLKISSGFTKEDALRLQNAGRVLAPHLSGVVDRFYDPLFGLVRRLFGRRTDP